MYPCLSPDTTRYTKGVVYLNLTLLGLTIALPFLYPFHTLPLPSFYNEWLAIALGLGACIVFLTALFWEKLSIPRSALHLLWLTGWVVFQSLIVEHVYAAQALLPALYLTWGMLLIVVAGWLRRQLGAEKVLGALAWFLFVGGTLQALAGLAQYLGLYGWLAGWIDFSPHNTIVGNIAQKNHLVAHVTLAALALIYLYAHRHISRGITYPLLMLFAVMLTLTGSRSVWLYIPIVSALSFIAYKKTRDPTHHSLAAYSALLLAFFVAAQLFMPAVNEWLNVLLGTDRGEIPTALQRGFSDAPRLVEWHKAWLIFLQSPIVGVGMGHYGWHSFNLHVLPGFASTSSSVLSHHAHNLLLEVAAELGIVGLILLVVLLASWLRQFFLNWLVPANWLVASVLLVLFIHSNLEYPSWYSYFLGTFLIFLALGDNRMTHATFSPRLGQISTAISLFLAGAILTATFSGYQVLKNIYHPSDETGISVTAERVKHVSLNPLLTPWAEITMVTTGKSNQGRIKEQLAVVSRATRFQPNPVKVRLQIIYFALADQPEDAIAWLRRFSKAYAPLLPAFICTMKESPHEKVRLLAHEGETILRRTLSCLEEEKTITH